MWPSTIIPPVEAEAAPEVGRDGYAIHSGVIDAAERQELIAGLGDISGAGRRGVLALPVVANLARSPRILDLVRPHLAAEPVPVRALYFDKSASANWLVPWHQDVTLALRDRVDLPGFGPWSHKDGVPHVQAPVALLEQMLTVRIHLDAAGASNGALQVVAGSHRFGRLPAERIQTLRASEPVVLCSVSAGDVVLMRPLLLHASSRSASTGHRRVLHLEYAGFALPAGLCWHEGG